VHDRQAQPGTFTDGLVREEWFEHALAHGRVHSNAGVADPQMRSASGRQFTRRVACCRVQSPLVEADLDAPAAASHAIIAGG
jgi:hypothetical protein